MQYQKRTIEMLLALALLWVLSACGATATPSTQAPEEQSTPVVEEEPVEGPAEAGTAADLDETAWLLASINGNPVLEGEPLTIGFHNEIDVGGFSGCNSFGGKYTADGNTLTISDVTQTLQLCEAPAGIMDQETAYLEALANAASYTVTDDTLEVQNEAGETILTFTAQEAATLDPALAGTEWLLTSLNSEEPLEGSHVTITFEEGQMSGFGGCNSYGGSYVTASGGVLEIEGVASTEMFCNEPEGVSEQETLYFETLSNATAYTVTDGQLALQNDAGEIILAFEAQDGVEAGSSLAGGEWVLTLLDGEEPIADSNVTLAFDEQAGQLGGFDGCNSYGSSYTITDEGILEISSEIASTMMLCAEPEGIGEQTTRYYELLRTVTAYTIKDGQLELLDADGETVLVFELQAGAEMDPAALVGTSWQLQSLNGSSPAEGSTITLAFLNETIASGNAGCRDYIFSYGAEGDSIQFPMQTMLGDPECLSDETLVQQEGQYTDAFTWANHYRVEAEQLEILTERGETLTFEALPHEVNTGLTGTSWQLTAFVAGQEAEGSETPMPMVIEPLRDSEISIQFEESDVAGSAGCNQYSAAYSLDGTALTIQPPTSTRMACDGPIMDLEQRFLTTLENVTIYQVVGGHLWLHAEDGSALLLEAQS